MCKHLIEINNPYYNKKVYAQEKGELVTVNRNLVDVREKIQVPCGRCSECRQQKINEYIQRAVMESLFSYVYFITLTYDDKHIPVIKINGEQFKYANYEHIKLMFKRFRRHGFLHGRDFRYLTVNEYGERKHRPHFHILLFVSKLPTDTPNTPYELEEEIKHIGDYFAENKGTKNRPIYERLFTYKTRRSYGKVKSNYFVKYVESQEMFTTVNYDFVPKEHNIKAIRYLVGYMNKPDKYEQKIEWLIDQYKDDVKLYNEYREILKSQVRMSKGFGCGFTDGKRQYLEKISVRCSTNTHVYTEVIDSLPDTYEEFKELYPSYNEELNQWIERDYYKYFSSWETAKNGMSAEEYLIHCTYLKYFKHEFNEKYRRYKEGFQPRISNYFDIVHNKRIYSPQVVRTSIPNENNKLYQYLRGMVEEGISKGIPYIAFRMNDRYMPMCKYYKERVTTFDDILRLYEKLGVKNYTEWLELFNKSLSNRAAVIEGGNTVKYFNDDEIGEVQNMNSEKNVYEILFTNRK